MCPFCLATAAFIAGGALGTAGLSAFVAARVLKKPNGKAERTAAEKEV